MISAAASEEKDGNYQGTVLWIVKCVKKYHFPETFPVFNMSFLASGLFNVSITQYDFIELDRFVFDRVHQDKARNIV